eukprot:gene2137-biopygen6459
MLDRDAGPEALLACEDAMTAGRIVGGGGRHEPAARGDHLLTLILRRLSRPRWLNGSFQPRRTKKKYKKPGAVLLLGEIRPISSDRSVGVRMKGGGGDELETRFG